MGLPSLVKFLLSSFRGRGRCDNDTLGLYPGWLVEVVVEIGIPTVTRLRVRVRDLAETTSAGKPILTITVPFCGTLHLGLVTVPVLSHSGLSSG